MGVHAYIQWAHYVCASWDEVRARVHARGHTHREREGRVCVRAVHGSLSLTLTRPPPQQQPHTQQQQEEAKEGRWRGRPRCCCHCRLYLRWHLYEWRLYPSRILRHFPRGVHAVDVVVAAVLLEFLLVVQLTTTSALFPIPRVRRTVSLLFLAVPVDAAVGFLLVLVVPFVLLVPFHFSHFVHRLLVPVVFLFQQPLRLLPDVLLYACVLLPAQSQLNSLSVQLEHVKRFHLKPHALHLLFVYGQQQLYFLGPLPGNQHRVRLLPKAFLWVCRMPLFQLWVDVLFLVAIVLLDCVNLLLRLRVFDPSVLLLFLFFVLLNLLAIMRFLPLRKLVAMVLAVSDFSCRLPLSLPLASDSQLF
ncbi:hypothetical protein ECC02_011012 [Trypanosoma cruzi]|uniref:Uncharacterized protein n=1 Tax=Trypanosoma cruzi TaxID=5693 RepID=A0A7J6XP63_TRYCR|nr:hypothetical protein ECC02_011012 [Trypanosoma cruzi]